MEILVAAVGKPRSPGLRESIEHYERRVGHYFRFRAIEVASASLPDDRATEGRTREGDALLRVIPSELEFVALTREGKSFDTRALTAHVQDIATYGRPGLAFAIGGAHGLDEKILKQANTRLSLSALTLPHEFARLLLAEQLYRVGTLIRGEPYHKGP